MAKRVLISYSHDSDHHASIVRNLVDHLRRDGCFWPKADCQFRGVGSVSMTAIESSGHSEMAILSGLVERLLYAR